MRFDGIPISIASALLEAEERVGPTMAQHAKMLLERRVRRSEAAKRGWLKRKAASK